MSGITATLTQTQQGRWEPVTHIGQPSSIRQESGTHRHLHCVPIFPPAFFLVMFLLIVPSPETKWCPKKKRNCFVNYEVTVKRSQILITTLGIKSLDNIMKNNLTQQKIRRSRDYKLMVTVFSLWEIFHPLGIFVAETLRPASRTWEQSLYLKHQRQELGEVLQDMDIKKPVTQACEL